MRKFRSAFALLQGQTSDWLRSPRTLISGLVILSLTYMNARSYTFVLESNELYSHWDECIFYYLSTGFGNISLVSVLFLVMMAEIPRRTPYQNSMLIRASRSQWFMSQVLFCLLITFLMIGTMLVLSMLMTLPDIAPGSGWSDLERLADPEANWGMQLTSEYIRVVSPLQASAWAAIILFAFWFTMALVILFCTLLGYPHLGLILYVSILVLHITVLWEELPHWMQYMPVHFATLSAIGSKFEGHEMKAIFIVSGFYLGLDIFMIWLISRKVKTMDLFFAEKDVER